MPKRILVIQLKMIGDVLVSSILCENLKLTYPNATIDYLVYDFTTAVLDHKTGFNIITLTEKEKKSKKAFITFLSQVRKRKYDVVIDCYAKLESWLIVLFSGAKQKISFDKGYSNFIYTDVIIRHQTPKTNLGLTIEQRLELLKPLNILEPTIVKPTILISADEKRQAIHTLKSHGIQLKKPLVMVSVMGSSEDKSYPQKYMIEILEKITDIDDIQLILNYMPNQKSWVNALLHKLDKKSRTKIFENIEPKGLRAFLGILNECDMIIGNDGGAINMAKALEIPAFTIYSPAIDKLGWNSFEDGKNYISVHLVDYQPHLFENLPKKISKEVNQFLYEKFLPSHFIDDLKNFIQFQISKINK